MQGRRSFPPSKVQSFFGVADLRIYFAATMALKTLVRTAEAVFGCSSTPETQ